MSKTKSQKILIAGASGDLGMSVLKLISQDSNVIGASYHKNKKVLEGFIRSEPQAKIKTFASDISSQKTAYSLVDSFVRWAGGIDGLVQLSGTIQDTKNWDDMSQKQWDMDIAANLTGPYFLAQRAMKYMKESGGKIILCSTASAQHGGGRTSMAYGAAKAAIECVTKGLARVGADDNILVNAVAPGFIKTKFHTDRMKRSKKEINQRAKLVLLKRAGEPADVAGMIAHLLSPYGNYITGEVIPISGGDWL